MWSSDSQTSTLQMGDILTIGLRLAYGMRQSMNLYIYKIKLSPHMEK